MIVDFGDRVIEVGAAKVVRFTDSFQIVLDDHAEPGWQWVLEVHRCGNWVTPHGARSRCGLVFGDGHHCDASPPASGEPVGERLYRRREPTPPALSDASYPPAA